MIESESEKLKKKCKCKSSEHWVGIVVVRIQTTKETKPI